METRTAGVHAQEANNPLARLLGALFLFVLRLFLYLFFGLLVLLAVLSCVLAPGGRGQQNRIRAFVRRRLAVQVSAFLRKMRGNAKASASGKDGVMHWL